VPDTARPFIMIEHSNNRISTLPTSKRKPRPRLEQSKAPLNAFFMGHNLKDILDIPSSLNIIPNNPFNLTWPVNEFKFITQPDVLLPTKNFLFSVFHENLPL
jgi:hypothetical protein